MSRLECKCFQRLDEVNGQEQKKPPSSIQPFI